MNDLPSQLADERAISRNLREQLATVSSMLQRERHDWAFLISELGHHIETSNAPLPGQPETKSSVKDLAWFSKVKRRIATALSFRS